MRRLVAAGLLVVAACGQGKSAAEVISGAPAAAAARGTARISLETTVRLSGQGQTFATVTKGDGASELGGARRGHMTLTVSTFPTSARPLQACEMISQGSVVYAKLPHPSGGKSWIKVDVAKVAGIDPSALSSDPSSQLQYLKSVSGAVKTLGHADIRGVRTTHYQYTVKVDEFLSKLPAATRQQTQSALKDIGISSFPLDTWIDNDGLPRRVSFDWKTTKQGATLDITTRVDTYDYGTNASLAAPSASLVETGSNPATAFARCFGAPPGALAGVPQS